MLLNGLHITAQPTGYVMNNKFNSWLVHQFIKMLKSEDRNFKLQPKCLENLIQVKTNIGLRDHSWSPTFMTISESCLFLWTAYFKDLIQSIIPMYWRPNRKSAVSTHFISGGKLTMGWKWPLTKWKYCHKNPAHNQWGNRHALRYWERAAPLAWASRGSSCTGRKSLKRAAQGHQAMKRAQVMPKKTARLTLNSPISLWRVI